MSKSMADTSNILTNGAIFSTLKHIEPHTVRGRSTQKDGVCDEHIFRNGLFRELKIAKESNDLADLANEFSVNRKFRHKDVMLDCEAKSSFYQSEDKRKLNCHKLRSSYVTSILNSLCFCSVKLSTLSAAIFLFVSLVLSLLCGRSTGVFHYCFFFQYSLSFVDISH